MVGIGETAPGFGGDAYWKGKITKINAKGFAGKWIVLFFYPRDFTFVCPTELKGFANAEKEFASAGAQLIAASTDSAYSHKAWFERDMPEVKYPILADTNHAISSAYGVLVEKDGCALRGTFIIDPHGTLQYLVISNLNVGRSVQETLRVLKALQTGGLCPLEWKPGMKTL
ncbi:MAG: peroxiredoxin [Candidatus Micrarchaeia archaeon]|jgi:alkyl hydroperoxide reductase subunit AhpC